MSTADQELAHAHSEPAKIGTAQTLDETMGVLQGELQIGLSRNHRDASSDSSGTASSARESDSNAHAFLKDLTCHSDLYSAQTEHPHLPGVKMNMPCRPMCTFI